MDDHFVTWSRRRLSIAVGALFVLTGVTSSARSADAKHKRHPAKPISRSLVAVDNSGVVGTVTLRRLRHGGTAVSIAATGLDEGTQ